MLCLKTCLNPIADCLEIETERSAKLIAIDSAVDGSCEHFVEIRDAFEIVIVEHPNGSAIAIEEIIIGGVRHVRQVIAAVSFGFDGTEAGGE